MQRKLTLIAFIAFLFYAGWHRYGSGQLGSVVTGTDSDRILARALAAQTSGLQVEGEGAVSRILPDDNEGGRHERFIIRLASGQTLLVAHNIDLSPRIAGLRVGDRILFNGVYEWNSRGGVIHWTHRDPAGRHAAGWIKHAGQKYD
jgi:hypothetical protein